MSGQKHMSAMNRQLLGQPLTPEIEKPSVAQNEFSNHADDLMQSALLQEAAQTERQPSTLNLREQISIFNSAPQEAGNQLGIHTSGTIFDGYDFQRKKKLETQQGIVQSFRSNDQLAPTPTETSTTTYEREKAAKIQQLREEALTLSKRGKSVAQGRTRTLHVQTEQASPKTDSTVLTLLRRMVKSIKTDQKRVNAFRLQQERMAKKPKKGPGAFLEGGADQKTSMVEQLAIIEAAGAQHELTTGE